MPKPARKSQSSRAIYARQWRESSYKDKRFNKPLKEYIELKYDEIYSEYCSFFKSLDEEHPSAKDLTKTRKYKKWKRQLLKHQSSQSEDESDTIDDQTERDPAQPDVLTVAIQGTLSPVVDEINIDINEADNAIQQIINELEQDDTTVQETLSEDEPDTIDDQTERDPPQPDVLTVAIQETLSPVVDEINIDINEADNAIQQIINELEEDDVIRDLINAENNGELVHPHYEDEDEGIGLNVEAELQDIIEPFDYELEVEGFDF